MRLWGLVIFCLWSLTATLSAASRDYFVSSATGQYAHGGTSWADAKNNLQEAINIAWDALQKGEITAANIYVAAGVYLPSEVAEESGNSVLHTAFKLYPGIRLYGGYAGTESGAALDPAQRVKKTDETGAWAFAHETILSGDHTTRQNGVVFDWSATRHAYITSALSSSYHVLWFATAGFHAAGAGGASDHAPAKALGGEAVVDGCTISGGSAGQSGMGPHAYGGGAYLTSGAVVRNCTFRRNAATRGGGALFLDGGGRVEDCYFYMNQSAGVGLSDGNGGAVMVWMNDAETSSTALLRRCVFVNNAARNGGAVYLRTTPGRKLAAALAGCVLVRNVATTEAGGAYLEGGVLNHCTILRNACYGTGVMMEGRLNGRSAGVFVSGEATIFNSVLWGGEVAANSDLQIASSLATSDRARLLFSAVQAYDQSDWTGFERTESFDLAAANLNPGTGPGQYAEFSQLTSIVSSEATAAGINKTLTLMQGGTPIEVGLSDYWKYFHASFVPSGGSDLRARSVRLRDLTLAEHAALQYADLDYDFVGKAYSGRSTIGAYTASSTVFSTADVEALDGTGGTRKTIFVDLDQKMPDASGTFGASWNSAANNLADALAYAATLGEACQVLVKAGTYTPRPAVGGRLRDNSFVLGTNVALYGGFSQDLTGTDIAGRNPVAYPTVLSGAVLDNRPADNVAHVVRMDGVRDAALDGVQVRMGNATPDDQGIYTPSARQGAGIWVGNSTGTAQTMSGNALRNVLLAHNHGEEGAALYVGVPSGSTVALAVTNTIIHNNTSTAADEARRSAVWVGQGSDVSIEHSNLVQNVGHPLVADGVAVTLNYSEVWANARRAMDDYTALQSQIDDRAHLFTLNGGAIEGQYNMVDVSETALTASTTRAVLTYSKTVGNDTYTFPEVNNPVLGIGASSMGDLTLYGGDADFTPTNMNPVVNAAVQSGSSADMALASRTYGGIPDVGAKENRVQPDLSAGVLYVRQRDGEDGTNGHDGMAWGKAFRTLRYALQQAEAANTATPGAVKKIYIAAGRYAENIDGATSAVTLLPGVDVLGGFLAYGNPGFQEGDRSIANDSVHYARYQTIIDGERKGRVLQGTAATADTKTVWEGLTFEHGRTTGTEYGAGVRLEAYNVLKNCLVQTNVFVVDNATPTRQGGAGIYANVHSEVKNCNIRRNTAINTVKTTGTFYLGGAGVYLNQALLINSLIVENTTMSARLILGSGVYISTESTFFNCTIAYNWGDNFRQAPATGGVWDNSGTSKFVNCLFWGNASNGNTSENFNQAGISGYVSGGGVNRGFFNCYHSAYNKATASDVDQVDRVFYTHPGVNEGNKQSLSALATAAEVQTFIDICRENQPFDASYNLVSSERSPLSQYCINGGVEEYNGHKFLIEEQIDEDIVGADRIQDCRIDKGAYEYNGAYDILPTLDTTAGSPTEGAYIYYVTELGAGQASATSAAQAACAVKLQKVLDAAGRFLLDQMAVNKEHTDLTARVPRVVVKLAGDQTQAQTFTYTPTRSANPNRENPRDFAFIVPRGVEVWGGYDNAFTERDLRKYPTTLNGRYTDDNQTTVSCFHILHFTTDTFDAEQQKRSGPLFVSFDEQMSPKKSLRAPIDRTVRTTGLPIYAVEFTSSLDASANPNLAEQLSALGRAVIDGIFLENGAATGTADDERRGGVALLPGFAHIRNCIVRNNIADGEGGALYLQENALVSGTLFTQNAAHVGGALYVAPEGGTTIDRRAKIFTSTVVKNTAVERGGGLAYQDNVLANSSVFWQNTAPLQANVSGVLAPISSEGISHTDNYYYLSYCAVENLRYPGLNNFSVATENEGGVRFTDRTYYGLKPYSILVRNGMPTTEYKEWVRRWAIERDGSADLVDNDFMGVSRHTHSGTDKGFIEIGARAFAGSMMEVPSEPSKVLTRLYVARPEDVSASMIEGLISGGDDIYSRPGSSQGYPFQKLDDALEYIRTARRDVPAMQDVEFEVLMGRGTFLPHRTVKGRQGYARTNTFLVPEGVSLFGGFDNTVTGTSFEGQRPGFLATAPAGYSIAQTEADALLDARPREDINLNNIVEPWEFAHQTFLSGKVVNSTAAAQLNVYHIVTALANPDYVGTLPTTPKSIVLDGLTLSDGYACQYEAGTDLDAQPHISTFYRGGAIAVLGQRGTADVMGSTDLDALPARNIPLTVRYCQLFHNVAGAGGAIFSDGDVTIHASCVAQNLADARTETVPGVPSYTGLGGAFYVARSLKLYNTLVANNEAMNTAGTVDGGRAILYAGAASTLELSNNSFVRNKAVSYPSIFAAGANAERNVLNTVFWGNEGADNLVVNEGSGVQLCFSAYEEGRGPEAVAADKDAAFTGTLATDLGVTNGNVIISSRNNDGNGPNFVHPSALAGAGGYTPAANWSPARRNVLTDAGWGGLVQNVTVGTSVNPDTGEYDYEVTFQPADAETRGFYITRANAEPKPLFKGADWTREYMHLNAGTGLSALRISKDPTPSIRKTYIDIGVYEYQHIQLKILRGQDVDTLWVATAEKLENGLPDGSSWQQPTADLQRAIETLLASRNGHHKLIYLIEGEYAPVRTVSSDALGNKLLAFTINTAVLDEAVTTAGTVKGIGSLTFRGGWSAEAANTQNVEAYPTVIRMQRHAGMTAPQYAHLFYIEDASNRVGKGTDAHIEGAATFPILIEGIRFENTLAPADAEGSALYFKAQTGVTTTNAALIDDGVEREANTWTYINPRENRHRLMLNRTQFALCEGQSAVRISEGGNDALVVNSLFHSNTGTALDAVNTTVLNSTFALNGKGVSLGDINSHLYNNILWQNTTAQFTNNGGVVQNNAVSGMADDVQGNVGLSAENDNIQTGPNFVAPNVAATTEADRRARNFQVLPSLRILNRGDNQTYTSLVYAHPASEATLKGLEDYQHAPEPKPTVVIVGNAPDSETGRSYETDLSHRQRIFGAAIERGAYESFANVQRVVYVDPTRQTADAHNDGTSWEKAYSVGELQSAVNIAAMYSAQNVGTDVESAKSYVFVKQGAPTGTIALLDGVQLYGSISGLYRDEAVKTEPQTGEYAWSNADLSAYLLRLQDERTAIASPVAALTYLEGLTASGTLSTGVLADGLGLRGAYGQMAEVSAAPLRLAATGTATAVLRNAIVYNYHATAGTVAEVSGGLLYNVLFRNNTGADGVVRMTNGGRMLNCTVVAEADGVAVRAEGATPLVAKTITANGTTTLSSTRSGDATAFAADAPLSNNTAPAEFAPYFADPNYINVFGTRHNLGYQLRETSDDIDRTTDAVDGFLTDAMKSAVDYTSDLDLLKNPRQLGAGVDRGAFETWTTQNGTLRVGGTSHTLVARSHHYPHEGSVVYAVKAGAGFAVDTANPPSEPVRPGYFLLQRGGWYGQGAVRLQLAYAALDRKVESEHLLVALPFATDYGQDTALERVATYDGAARAAERYRAVSDNSTLWTPVQSGRHTPANVGVYARFKESVPTTHRFTGIAPSALNSYVYEEQEVKSVTLTQYNATPTDGTAAYTTLENMGWNLFGQPYMVSDYTTGGVEDAQHTYPMDIPHVLTRLNASAAYATFPSWDIGATLRAGEGVFTQTATKEPVEHLTFRLPSLSSDGTLPSPRKVLRLSTEWGSDELTLLPSPEARSWKFSVGGNGVKWSAIDERLPQVSVADDGGRYSLLSAVPTAVDIPLSVEAGAARTLRFSLPDRSAYVDHEHVWLLDRTMRRVIDLRVDDYEVEVSSGLEDLPSMNSMSSRTFLADASRFVLRIGGLAPIPDAMPSDGVQKVRVADGRLRLALPAPARVEIYDTAGRCLHRFGTTAQIDLSLPNGVYLLRTLVEE